MYLAGISFYLVVVIMLSRVITQWEGTRRARDSSRLILSRFVEQVEIRYYPRIANFPYVVLIIILLPLSTQLSILRRDRSTRYFRRRAKSVFYINLELKMYYNHYIITFCFYFIFKKYPCSFNFVYKTVK